MTQKRSPILDAINDPSKNFLTTFLVSTLFFNIIADGVSSLFWGGFNQWLQTQLGITSKSQLQGYILLALVLLMLMLIYGTNLAQRLRGLLLKLGLFGTEIPDRATVTPLNRMTPGLVVLMSTKPDSPAERAIRYHWNHGNDPHLKHCWVICTESSLDYAVAMKQSLLADGIDENQLQIHYGSYPLNDPGQPGLTLTISDRAADDPDTILNLVNAIFVDAQAKGLDESDLMVDFTGGTKPMGVGAVLACASPNRSLEYFVQTDQPQLAEIKVSYKIKPAK